MLNIRTICLAGLSLVLAGICGLVLLSCGGKKSSTAKLQTVPGMVSVYAGSGGSGSTIVPNNPLRSALAVPKDLAVRRDGSLLISDFDVSPSLSRILQISPNDKRIEIVAGGNGTGSKLVQNNPRRTQLGEAASGLAVLHDNSVLIADGGNHRVLRLEPDGKTISVFAGTGHESLNLQVKIDPNNPRNTELVDPHAVVELPDNSVLVADFGQIIRITPNRAHVERVVGTGRLPPNRPVGSNRNPLQTDINPGSLAVRHDGSILISDESQVLLLSRDRKRISGIAGVGNRQLIDPDYVPTTNQPRKIALDPGALALLPDDSVLIADITVHRIYKLSSDLKLVSLFAGSGPIVGFHDRAPKFDRYDPSKTTLYPLGLAVLPDASVLVSDGVTHKILRIRS